MSPTLTQSHKLEISLKSNTAADGSSMSHLEGIQSTPSHLSNTETSIEPARSKRPCSKNPFQKIKLEILTFLFMFSYTMTRITSTAMIVEKVCLSYYKHPSDICDNLTNHTNIKASVERVSTNYQLGYNIIQAAPAAILSCYIGPWSDRYGRKLPLVLATIGMILTSLGSSVCAYFLNSPVEYYYIPAVFAGIFGGNICLIGIVYSYASDTTSSEGRTMKYAYIELSRGLAVGSGTAAGGWIYEFFGYPSVFCVSLGGFFATLLWVSFMMPETQGLDNTDDCGQKMNNLFSCATFKESFVAALRKRPHNGRLQILLLILTTCFIAMSTSSGDIDYLFVHHQFNWGNAKYSSVSSIYTMVAIGVLVVLVPLFRYLRVADPTLGLIGSSSILIKLFGVGLSFDPVVYHVANVLGCLSPFSSMSARSRISKVVSKDDLGKVFQFVASGETLLPVLSTVLTSLVFYATLNVYPGAPYIMLGIFLILPFSVFVWLRCVPDLNCENIENLEGTSANKNNEVNYN